ncbi:MAG: zf-TFIIB domain-containing protein [Magnetococcus sp. WYHC-3]
MKCPECNTPLKSVRLDDLEVDVCPNPHCAGLWFDRTELARVDKPHAMLGEKLLDELPFLEHRPAPRTRPMLCPRCDSVQMERRPASRNVHEIIDYCPRCGGSWLQGGGLAAIRRENASRESELEEHFSELRYRVTGQRDE